MPNIRFATYNIHKGCGLDGRTRVERIGRVLAEIQADVVALQEVVSQSGAQPEDDQARYLGELLGRFHVMGETRKHQGGRYGNVTLSKWDFEFVKQIDLSVSRREERGALRTDVRACGQVLHVSNVHLGTGHGERRQQATRFLEKGRFART